MSLETILGHTFTKRDLLETALTHASAGKSYNYERLEFLGDRVLGLVVSEMLYRNFPDEPEGHLAKRLAALVQGAFLADRAEEIKLGDYIQFSEAEREAGGQENTNILADVFESLIGALYLDGGYKVCEALIHKHWSAYLNDMKAPPQHPKTALQEWAQGQGLSLPAYDIASQKGPDHAPIFEIRLTVQNYDPVFAEGRSRQDAEKKAAQSFLDSLK